jgi:protein-tyrosine phosphatase
MQRFILLCSVFLGIIGLGAAAVSQNAPAVQSSAVAGHQRLLPLEGGQNFRDLGGYPTVGGRHVRWGLLFRSGSMHNLTRSDFAYLRRVGIRTVCDFRDTRERAHEPVEWPTGQAPTILAKDYLMESRDIGIPTSAKPWTKERARAVMRQQYAAILPRFGAQYRDMFEALLAGQVPLAFNCSAGKDRTGVAAALVLTALGVPRKTIIEDYLLSNRYLDTERALKSARDGAGEWSSMPRDALLVFLSVDGSFLEATFAVMDAHKGGSAGYLRDEMGLGPAEIQHLRAAFTQ